jgi:DNA repair photolyase
LLFPECERAADRLIGIARLAAEGPVLEAKRRVDYRELESRSYIARCTSPRMPFRYMINPYRGCEFGCKYCYARYTHEFMELRDPEDFETIIFAKRFNGAAFRAELAKVPKGEDIAIGTATDPYQPAERRYGILRSMLEIIEGERGRSVWITTKSDLVARDADLLARIGQRNYIQVSLTITTADEDLARLVEPYAPRPALRLAAIQKLSAAGVPCGVMCAPIMPLINDSEASIDAVAAAAAQAGARWLHGHVVFLKPCAKQVFLPFLEQRFPHLVKRYRARFERNAFLSGEYPDLIAKRIHSAKERYGLTHKANEYRPEFVDDQLNLFS